jgi:hypothetical protein
MQRRVDQFALLGIFLDAVGQVLGPFSDVERATRRAMFTSNGQDLAEASAEFDRLPGQVRRRVSQNARVRAEEVAVEAGSPTAAPHTFTPPPLAPVEGPRARRVAPKPAAPVSRPASPEPPNIFPFPRRGT